VQIYWEKVFIYWKSI